MPKRTCDVPECGKAHRSRGLCSTHYNQRHQSAEQRHPHEVRACVVCATSVRRRVDATYSPTCSVACRTIVQCGGESAQTGAYDWRTDAAKRAREAGCLIIEDFDRSTVFERDGWTCRLCGIACEQPDPFNPRAATVDHVVPLSRRGDHALANVQTACLRCNASKQDSLTLTTLTA